MQQPFGPKIPAPSIKMAEQPPSIDSRSKLIFKTKSDFMNEVQLRLKKKMMLL
jgi:hypothetical protein